jgi:hypothetical protein
MVFSTAHSFLLYDSFFPYGKMSIQNVLNVQNQIPYCSWYFIHGCVLVNMSLIQQINNKLPQSNIT